LDSQIFLVGGGNRFCGCVSNVVAVHEDGHPSSP
jgi:hypothetical protein